MKASETNFQPIIEGTKQYVVPLFQRAYSWDKKEWEVLWEDLADLCQNPEPKSHFIGSIVTMPTTSVPEGVSKFLLIDGQQRLTTIFILLTLLRDLAKKDGSQDLADEISHTMLVNPFKKGVDYFKLLPTQVDRSSLEKLLLEGVDGDSQIGRCYEFFERKINQDQPDIRGIAKVITSRLSVVSIVLDHDDNPHLVFESLNAKGRPLTQSDLIRNYFFMRIHVDEQESIHDKYWQPMQSILKESLTEYIRHYLMRNGVLVKQNEVYFTLKDRIGQSEPLPALKEIAQFAIYYQRLLDPICEPELKLRTALSRINRLDITTAYPFLLDCYHDYDQNKISLDQFIDILEIVENFVIRRFVCNVPSNELNKIFPPLFSQAQLRNPSNLPAGVRLVLQSRGYPKDIEFRARLTEAKLYGAGERNAKTKLILETLEAAYQHKEQPPFETLTIEHVMPQTLTDWWQQYLGAGWLADHELYLHTIGNLTLTAYNPELSNDTFTNKKQRFATSHLELNRYFMEVDRWDREAIENRSKILAEIAIIAWPYFGSDQTTPVTTDAVTGKIPKLLIFLGQKSSVTSWRDVLIQTIDTIADLEPEAFSILAQEYPRLISLDPKKFRKSRELGNGFFMEVNLSARDIHRFCIQAIECIGLSSYDWIVETN